MQGAYSPQRLGVDLPATRPAWDSNLRPPACERRPVTKSVQLWETGEPAKILDCYFDVERQESLRTYRGLILRRLEKRELAKILQHFNVERQESLQHYCGWLLRHRTTISLARMFADIHLNVELHINTMRGVLGCLQPQITEMLSRTLPG